MANVHIRHVDDDDNRRAVSRARLEGTNLSTVFRAWLKEYAAGLEASNDRQTQSVTISVAVPAAAESPDADV